MPLDRFRDAQNQSGAGFETALAELRAGRKRSHWVWYIFPQLPGLGSSEFARIYAIHDRDEAVDYLRDETLRARLLAVSAAVAEHASRGVPLATIMGSSIDTSKLVSSMTLFAHVSKALDAEQSRKEYREIAETADNILAIAAAQGYPPCAHTLQILTSRNRAIG